MFLPTRMSTGTTAPPKTSANPPTTAARHPSRLPPSPHAPVKTGEQSCVDGYLEAQGLWRNDLFKTGVVQAVLELANPAPTLVTVPHNHGNGSCGRMGAMQAIRPGNRGPTPIGGVPCGRSLVCNDMSPRHDRSVTKDYTPLAIAESRQA